MTTSIKQFHHLTQDVALLETSGSYWIGSFNPHLTHQNDEPPYVWIAGDFQTLDAAQLALSLTSQFAF